MTLTGKTRIDRGIDLDRRGHTWHGRFSAMASPCELLIEGGNEELAMRLSAKVAQEAWRIERKFSRYRQDNIIHAINNSATRAIKVDGETARLLDYAAHCWALSDGLFDVTSGVLRRVWRFDGSDRIPSTQSVEAVRPLIGWDKLSWKNRRLSLPEGMQIDLGGIGKEYAVDRAFEIAARSSDRPLLVNFGGDLRCSGPRSSGAPWQVGIETLSDPNSPRRIELYAGALATSGDARRFLERDGQRYSHVLDPRSGWPVRHAPRSVTVADESCTQAGLIATLALLHGAEAEQFLCDNGVTYWCQN